MPGWLASVVRRLRAGTRNVRRLVDSPRPHAALIGILVAVLIGLTWAEATTLAPLAGPIRPTRSGITGAFIVAAGLLAVVQWRATVLAVASARNAELDAYCRTYATSRRLIAQAAVYRGRLERREYDSFHQVRSRIPSLITP